MVGYKEGFIMFSSFNKAFIDEPQFESKPPKAVIEILNKNLPKDVSYNPIGKGFCIRSNYNELLNNPKNIILSDEAKLALPKEPTIDEIKQYSYNSQTDILVSSDEYGFFTINDKKIKVSDMLKNAYTDVNVNKISFSMRPSHFPEPFEIIIGGNGYDKKVTIERKPNNSLNIVSFKTQDQEPLSIEMILNKVDISLKIIFSIYLDKAKTIYEIITLYEIYNAFMIGEGSINNNKLDNNIVSVNNMVPKDIIDFWKRLYAIEKMFNISLEIKKQIEIDDIECAEGIYRCLFENKPYKTSKRIKSVSLNTEYLDTNNGCFLVKDTEGCFELSGDIDFELFGQKIELKGVSAIFGARVMRSIKKNNNVIETFLEQASDKKIFESLMLFSTEEKLNEFLADDNHVNILYSAEKSRNNKFNILILY